MEKKRNSFLRKVLIKTASAASSLFIENHLLQVTEYRIASQKIPTVFDGFKIVQLSDLHSKSFGRGNARLIQKINTANPDLIVMTGDMVTRSDTNHNEFYHLAETLGRKYPCYYVVGNHELDMDHDKLKAFLSRAASLGVHVLDNTCTELHREDQIIRLYGMWFPLNYYKEAKHSLKHEQFAYMDMRRAMGDCDTNQYGILLTHNPLSFPVYADWGADLTLCGHVHGGMIRLPFLGGLLSPEREFFPKYSGGLYERNGRKLLVSRGLGSGLFGARIFNCLEIVIITICHED